MPADFVFFYEMRLFVNKFNGKQAVCKNSLSLVILKKITCIIFENLFVPYFLPHQSHSYGYAPSSGENLIQI